MRLRVPALCIQICNRTPGRKRIAGLNDRSNKTIEGFVSYKLSLLSRLINRRSTRYFAEEFNMTLAEWRCLVQIAEGLGSNVRDISERTYADKGQISRAAQGLLAKGLIVGKSDPLDRRSIRYKATPKGKALFQSIIALRKSENEAVVDLLTPDQQRVFFDSLDLLMAKFAQDEISYEG
jgi:DNA-binding MarR family transcriptional regulator